MKRLSLTFLATTLLFAAPAIAFGADFVPLAPIPGLNGAYDSLPDYLNAIITAVIGVAAILAVVMIVVNGLKYMTSEAVPEHAEALKSIRGTLMGLILLLLSWLILYVINPDILKLGALNNSLERPEAGQRMTPPNSVGEGFYGTSGTDAEAKACAAKGGKYEAVCDSMSENVCYHSTYTCTGGTASTGQSGASASGAAEKPDDVYGIAGKPNKCFHFASGSCPATVNYQKQYALVNGSGACDDIPGPSGYCEYKPK